MKRIIKQCIAILLLGIMIVSEIPLQTFAEWTAGMDTGTNGEGGLGNTTEWDTSGIIPDTYLRQCDIGLRIYVTDAYGNVQPTDAGFHNGISYDAIDFVYDELNYNNTKVQGYNGTSYLRCTANPKQGYNILKGQYITNLGFNDYKPVCKRIHGNNPCACTTEYFVDRYVHDLIGPNGHPIRNKLFLTEVEGDKIAKRLLETCWGSTLDKYLSQKQTSTENVEMYMHVEIVFGIVHHVTNPTTPEWYGSMFEYGCYTDAENNKRINVKNKNKYMSYNDDYWTYLPNAFYIDNNFECFKNFSYMQPASYQKNLYSKQIEAHAYGIYSMSFNTFVRVDNKTDKTEIPVSGDIEVKKEEATTISKVQNEDVEIRTGYAAQNGYYDIGTDSGIPTTEEIRNVIEAQDCIIDYAYVYEKYVPEKFPTVTYKFDYYVPCTCPEETHEDDDYGYDENGNYVVTGSHTVVDKPYGHHKDRS